MFTIKEWRQGQGNYYISDDDNNYIHSDGSVLHSASEYWPTKEQAQAVLDKYQPPHVWVHGDVFRRKSGTVMVYLVIHEMGPVVYLLNYSGPGRGMIDVCLADATFLFNIKNKLGDS